MASAAATLPMMPMDKLDAAAAAAAAELDDHDGSDGGGAAPSPCAADDARPASTTKRPASSSSALARWCHDLLLRLRSWLMRVVEWAAEEFDPWLKWVIFDALFALATARLAARVAAVRPLFIAVGWA